MERFIIERIPDKRFIIADDVRPAI